RRQHRQLPRHDQHHQSLGADRHHDLTHSVPSRGPAPAGPRLVRAGQNSLTSILRTSVRAQQPDIAGLPGADLVAKGIDDLANGVESDESLLVSIGAPRLSELGFEIVKPIPTPEHRLYELLAATDSDSAHSRYNALIRRLVS